MQTCMNAYPGMDSIGIRLHFNTPNPAVLRVKTVYLQSLQEAEVLKGSPLHDADLIVLQMTVAADRERERDAQKHVIKYHN